MCLQYQLVREDPFAELAASLQTRQAAACDGEVLNLNCPSGTKVRNRGQEQGSGTEVRKKGPEQRSGTEVMNRGQE